MSVRRSARLRQSSAPLKVSQENGYKWRGIGGHRLMDTTLDTALDITDDHLSRWQFSAPRYMDLGKADDETGNASQWFENRIASPATGVLNSPLVEFTPVARKLRKRSSIASLGPPQRVLRASHTPKRSLNAMASLELASPSMKDDMVVPSSPVWKVEKSPEHKGKNPDNGNSDDSGSGSSNNEESSLPQLQAAIAPLAQRRTSRLSQGAVRILKKSPGTILQEKVLGIRHTGGVKKRATSSNLHTSSKSVSKRTSNNSGLLARTQKFVERMRQTKPFKSAAQFINELRNKTPDRFRTRPAPLPAGHNKPLELTQPVSPNLRTKSTRARNTVTSTEATSTVDKKNTFKARPVNYKVLNSAGDLGVPKIAKPRPTVPKSPNFTKLPSERRREHQSTTTTKKDDTTTTAATTTAPPKLTVPQPFNFVGDAISANKMRRLQERLEQERIAKEEASRIKVAPVPILKLPPPVVPPLTEPQPFHLLTEERGEIYQAQFKAWQEEIERQNQENREFHAQPILKGKPVEVKPSDQPLTTFEPVHFQLDERIDKRREFDERIREQQHQAELERQAKQKEDEERERLALIEYRKKIAFKANPIAVFPAIHIRRSSKPLTVPRSPAITKAALRRARRHSEKQATNTRSRRAR
ncbi:hypothetical protein BDF22DRAFT_746248 [Syncephalis plumigaleata]|nr:hypothetical protein BDF22DRAFT_746248 [Syncephalis plumigaleata]